MTDLGPLTQVVSRTLSRVRLQRALEGATAALALWFALGLCVRLVQRWWFFRTQNEPGWWIGVAFVAALLAWLWPVRRESIAARLDQAHDFSDRVRTALDFSERAQRTRFMEAAIQDAVTRAGTLSAQRAAPFRAPRARYVAALLGIFWLAAGLLPARTTQATVTAPGVRAMALSADELSSFREELAQLERVTPLSADEEAQRAAYRALIERIGRGELERATAIEALLSLEKRLLPDAAYDPGADKQALAELAKDLAKADEALAGALAAQDTKQAAAALAALAKTLEAKSASDRAKLKEALELVRRRADASESSRKREAELESLLKRPKAPQTPDEKRLLERNKRELERLRRDNQTAQERSRELARLERDLAQAGQALDANAPDQAQSAMKRGAEDLRRLAQEQGTREQREALAKQVAQLRELLQRQREQNQGKDTPPQGKGNSQEERNRRFVLRAGGQDPEAEQTKLLAPKEAKGGKNENDGADPGQEGATPGDKGKPALQLGGTGPDVAQIELPGMMQRTLESQPSAGHDHDARKLRNATDIESELRDSQVAGTSSKGPVRSQVILDAADRGFATASYRKVYGDYRTHAEEALDKQEIPSGYRFYVRRYFQLVRPREERTAP